ncbi:uncharacterized protein N0V89_009714 [Didymosphaeria variabile]|uniref:AMMECR1 domain-containing protein n=1 Tax=Didymosphaeria variabile TaxID=1932322 RepID=A0A9W8XE94_9PLEO|nr:uncharacterized protein N0V89_009714 [Didymosphaeria variabile]KAJ4348340.1 hypothetical protein N0V89_009714 [Didymosphaeria variabile]
MATQAHCAYCFETLSANLEKRAALNLRQVEELWNKYNAEPFVPDPNAPEDDIDENEDVDAAPTATDGSPYRPAAISRLLAPSPATTSSSSVQSTSSTPSGASEASSATSKNSSRSSFFSLGRRAGKEESETATPLFVTWNVVHRSNGTRLKEKRLRGCIGTFEAQELDRGLRQYAIISALEDTRFNPISKSELPTLECGVTLLTNFEPVSDPLDWTVGTHGLRISFTYHGRRYGSTYLPDVAKEQGWTKEETLVSLMRKAGWSGRKEDWSKVELSVVRYQGRQVRLEYRDWEEWRAWVEGDGGVKVGWESQIRWKRRK